MHSGIVLTHVYELEQLEDCVRRGHYDTVKLVTGWGLDSGWQPAAMQRVLSLVPITIVRTVSGDPSYGTPDLRAQYQYPLPERVQAEIAPWYALRPDILIEIGNEPNIQPRGDDFIWEYTYYLAQTIIRCRTAFPNAQLIAPALILDPVCNPRRFLEICHPAMEMCDYIGVHVYEYYGFMADQQQHATTHHLRDAWDLYGQFFGAKDWFITEYGINDIWTAPATKGMRYAQFINQGACTPAMPANVKGAAYYHLCARCDIHPEYHIYPLGDELYGRN